MASRPYMVVYFCVFLVCGGWWKDVINTLLDDFSLSLLFIPALLFVFNVGRTPTLHFPSHKFIWIIPAHCFCCTWSGFLSQDIVVPTPELPFYAVDWPKEGEVSPLSRWHPVWFYHNVPAMNCLIFIFFLMSATHTCVSMRLHPDCEKSQQCDWMFLIDCLCVRPSGGASMVLKSCTN